MPGVFTNKMLSDLDLLNSAEESLKWFIANSSKIKNKYPNKLIAIKDKTIVASSGNTEELLKTLKEKGIDDSEVLIEVIPSKDEITIF